MSRSVYEHQSHGTLLVNLDYQYSDDFVRVLADEIKTNQVSNFYIGDVISKEEYHDSSGLITLVGDIVTKPFIQNQKVTLAFPNCDSSGHWRLFIMQYIPSNLETSTKFFLVDSLHDGEGEDRDTINTIFQNNIVPIFHNSGLEEQFGINAETTCQAINLGLQSTGVGDDVAQNTQACGPLMLRNLRILCKYGVGALQEPEILQTILQDEKIPLPSTILDSKNRIAELKLSIENQIVVFDADLNGLKSLVSEEQISILGEYCEMMENLELHENELLLLRSEETQNTDKMQNLMDQISESRDLVNSKLGLLKENNPELESLNQRKNELIDSIISQFKTIREQEFELQNEEMFIAACDEDKLETELQLRVDDAITLASLKADALLKGNTVEWDRLGKVAAEFEGIENFSTLAEAVGLDRVKFNDAELDEKIARLNQELTDLTGGGADAEVEVVGADAMVGGGAGSGIGGGGTHAPTPPAGVAPAFRRPVRVTDTSTFGVEESKGEDPHDEAPSTFTPSPPAGYRHSRRAALARPGRIITDPSRSESHGVATEVAPQATPPGGDGSTKQSESRVAQPLGGSPKGKSGR